MVYGIDTPLIASNKNGFHPIKKNRVESIIRNIGMKANVTKLHPHLFRATYATNQLLSGKDLITVSKLLGHEKNETTKEYVLLTDDNIQQMITRIE